MEPTIKDQINQENSDVVISNKKPPLIVVYCPSFLISLQ